MLRIVLPVVMALMGLGAGAGAGFFLRPATEAAAAADTLGADAAPAAAGHGAEGGHGKSTAGEHDFVKLNNQFIVPVLDGGKVTALVILSLSLEVTAGGRETVYAIEPKLRDAFLRVLFAHANAGGFDGNFTSGNNMVTLRDALREAGAKVLGQTFVDVLISDMVRQDA